MKNKSKIIYKYILVAIIIITAGLFIKTKIDMNSYINKDMFPNVRYRPLIFVNTGKYDPADSTSTFCYVDIEIKNYGNALAKDIDVEKIIISSQSRGSIIINNYVDSKKLPLYLNANMSIMLRVGFVLNPNVTLKKYDEGKESLNIEMYIKYRDVSEKQYKYYGKWYYINKEFIPVE